MGEKESSDDFERGVADTSDSPTSLADILLRRTNTDPESPFILTMPEGEDDQLTTRTYAEIFDRSQRLRTTLNHLDVMNGEVVGCYLSNAPAWVVATFAVWNSGGVVAAVGTLLPATEALRLFRLGGARVVIRAQGTESLGSEVDEIVIDDEGFVVSSPDGADTGSTNAAPVCVGRDDIACIFFTSGTTGLPKGITHTHGDFVDGARKVAAGYARSDVYRPRTAPSELAPGVVFNPFGHTAGFGRLGFRMWIGRASVLIPKFSVAAVRTLLQHFEFDSLQLTPAMVYMLATTDEPLALGGIAYVTSGTAPLAIATRERFESRYGVPVMQAYGMTEVGSIATERMDDIKAGRRGPGSVGRISKGVTVSIRDRESGSEADVGVDGEILVRAIDIATEFVGGAPVPVDAEGWFATGDVGHFDADKILYITGRAQEKLIVGGFNVYPAEVEDVARETAGVLDVVVVGLPDERLGEIPVAGVVWEGGPDEALLLEEMRKKLAHYKVPRSFFQLESIPLTPREKVDRRKALELAKTALAQSSGEETLAKK